MEIPNVLNRLLQPLQFFGRKYNHSGDSGGEKSTLPNQDGKPSKAKETMDKKQETLRPEEANQSGQEQKQQAQDKQTQDL